MERIEIWKNINGYESYLVSNFGNVKSLNYNKTKKEKLLKQERCKGGYFRVSLFNSIKKKKRFFVHRLVAIHFIPNMEEKPEVNHKDENPSNNHVENLEWVTSRENIEYSLTKKGITKIKGINWIERMKSYQCSVWLNKKKHYLGSTRDLEKAKELVSNFLIKNNI